MWLVFLRFDGGGRTKTTHVTAASKAEAKAVVEQARAEEPEPGLKLSEYGLFYAHANIKQKEYGTLPGFVPNWPHAADGEAARRAPPGRRRPDGGAP